MLSLGMKNKTARTKLEAILEWNNETKRWKVFGFVAGKKVFIASYRNIILAQKTLKEVIAEAKEMKLK